MNFLLNNQNLLNLKTKAYILVVLGSIFTCYGQNESINKSIDQWHIAASKAQAETYFNLMTSDATFVGSDAEEVWDVKAFKKFALPYFSQGKAWTFTPVSRNIYTSNSKLAWFDEVLTSAHMGLCRGSGVVEFVDNRWKIKHYVLSVIVPNEMVDQLTKMKQKHDQDFTEINKN